MKVAVTVKPVSTITRNRLHVEVGLPLPQKAVMPGARWSVLDERGKALPCQFKALIRHPDGSLRAVHGVFVLEGTAARTRRLTVTDELALQDAAGPPILGREGDSFVATTGDMRAAFNAAGQLISLRYGGKEMLDTEAGPSMVLGVTLGPAGMGIKSHSICARIKEAGPVRSILNLSGGMTLGDRRGDFQLVLDCDYVFYVGESEMHVRPMLLGAVTEAAVITSWSLELNIRNGRRIIYGRARPLVRKDPNHENMTWRGLDDGWVSWTLEGGASLTAWSGDFARNQNGIVRCHLRDPHRRRMKIIVGRVEPLWWYQDVSHTPTPLTINRGSWRRWELSLAVHEGSRSPRHVVAPWKAPLWAFASPEYYRAALTPWLEGTHRATPLWKSVAAKCREFVCKEPEYVGSLHGGWDSPNRCYLERGVSRGDFGEYLFNEFFRGGQGRFYRMAFDFGRIYRDIFCFTIPSATTGAEELGGARNRADEHSVCSIRSYRGAVLLAYMYHQTGDERYLDAVRQRADFHLANYPHQAGRLSMGTRDSAFMGWYLRRPDLYAKAVENTLYSLNKHFDPQHGFFEYYDHSRTLPDGRYPVWPRLAGWWNMRDFLYTDNASPEMTAYNIIGWYGLTRLHRLDDATTVKIGRVCQWFRDRQNRDGSWPYPHDTSKTRWGHGCFQDALAMICAYKMFGDMSYIRAVRKSFAFAESCMKKFGGRIPLLLGVLPHQETEDSLTYYYGLEALAFYEECAGGERGKT